MSAVFETVKCADGFLELTVKVSSPLTPSPVTVALLSIAPVAWSETFAVYVNCFTSPALRSKDAAADKSFVMVMYALFADVISSFKLRFFRSTLPVFLTEIVYSILVSVPSV